MSNRIIKSAANDRNLQLNHALRSIFAMEIFAPSSSVYLISPWITDVVIIDSSFGQFRALFPESDRITLSELLNSLVDRGTDVFLAVRPPDKIGVWTSEFLGRLSEEVQIAFVEGLHEKGLITDHFYFRGSMNFTYSGMHSNIESSEFTSDPGHVASAKIEAKYRWESFCL